MNSFSNASIDCKCSSSLTMFHTNHLFVYKRFDPELKLNFLTRFCPKRNLCDYLMCHFGNGLNLLKVLGGRRVRSEIVWPRFPEKSQQIKNQKLFRNYLD